MIKMNGSFQEAKLVQSEQLLFFIVVNPDEVEPIFLLFFTDLSRIL